jgi:hypothetical protein
LIQNLKIEINFKQSIEIYYFILNSTLIWINNCNFLITFVLFEYLMFLLFIFSLWDCSLTMFDSHFFRIFLHKWNLLLFIIIIYKVFYFFSFFFENLEQTSTNLKSNSKKDGCQNTKGYDATNCKFLFFYLLLLLLFFFFFFIFLFLYFIFVLYFIYFPFINSISFFRSPNY